MGARASRHGAGARSRDHRPCDRGFDRRAAHLLPRSARGSALLRRGRNRRQGNVYEDNPTHQTLVGRVERIARLGTLITDFNLLAPGALHRSNGGYLILDASKLLGGNYGWASLKRALNAGEIRIETLEQLLSQATTVSLEPEPIPLDVKVILIGPPGPYYLLSAHDEEFPDLFKIAADFDDRMVRTSETVLLYARFICALARREQLRPLDRDGVARIVEYASRLAGDGGQMSIEMRAIADVLREADQLAADAKREIIGATEVEAAIAAKFHRGDRIYRRLLDEIAKKSTRVETEGAAIGQVNGLFVTAFGGASFGVPSRITARVRLGRGELVDIEREVALGGPLHSKGVLILAGFLGGRFVSLRGLKKEIEFIDAAIDKLVAETATWREKEEQLRSVPGAGKIVSRT